LFYAVGQNNGAVAAAGAIQQPAIRRDELEDRADFHGHNAGRRLANGQSRVIAQGMNLKIAQPFRAGASAKEAA
jgi:hypothetical protein